MKPQNSIPKVAFSEERSRHGCDLFELHELVERAAGLEHRIDQPHRVLFNHITFVREGCGAHMIDFEHLIIEGPAILLVPCGALNRFVLPSKMKASLLLISNDALEIALETARLHYLRGLFQPSLTASVIPLDPQSEAEIQAIYRTIGEELQRRSADAPHMVTALLQALMLWVNRCRKELPPLTIVTPHMDRFLCFLRGFNETQSRNAADHARRLGISYKHLNTICREITGQSAKTFIDGRIIQESKRDLVATDLTVAEIALRLGFDEPTNFGKFFKRRTGEPPLAFRQRMNARD